MWGAGGENRMRKLMHQDKDREIANQLLLQATQTRLGENSLTAPLWAFPMGCSASGKNLCCSPWALHRLQLCQAAHLAWHGEICPGILVPPLLCLPPDLSVPSAVSDSCYSPPCCPPDYAALCPYLNVLSWGTAILSAGPSHRLQWGCWGHWGSPAALTTSAQAPTSSTAKKLWTRE